MSEKTKSDLVQTTLLALIILVALISLCGVILLFLFSQADLAYFLFLLILTGAFLVALRMAR